MNGNSLSQNYWDEGKIEGILIGQEKGKLEGKLEIAKAMLKDGFQLEKGMLFTGLSESISLP